MQRAVLLALLVACSAPPTPPPPVPVPPPSAPRTDPDAELEARTRDVVVNHRASLRACYEDALAKSPGLQGRVVLVVEVGQNGRAERVLEGRRDGLNDEVVKCLARELRSIAFHDGAARAIRIQVPLAFANAPAP
jgi:hypothetical protein